jgi:hypothetical protein
VASVLVSGTKVLQSPAGWSWYFHHPDWYTANKDIVDPLVKFVDNVTMYYTEKFGYRLAVPNHGSLNGEWIVEVTDESSGVGGGAGGEGMGLTGGAILNSFFARSFSSHELANVFTGQTTGGWPWANGSSIWRALNPNHSPFTSPFPYAASVMALTDLGFPDDADKKVSDAAGDLGFQLIYAIFVRYGWVPFASLMTGIEELGINLSNYPEPVKTGIVMAVISWKSGYDYITTFNEFFAAAGVGVAQGTFNQILGLFSGIRLSGLKPTGITLPSLH